jgi:hypothetical protein
VSANLVDSSPRTGLRTTIRLAARVPAVAVVAMVALCAPILVACSATGFGSPTRHAIANLQAASVKIGSTLQIEDAIIALPSHDVSAKGGLAYLQFDAINFSNQPDPLLNVSADLNAPAVPAASSGAASSAAPAQPAAESLQAAGITTVPAATASGPGTIRINVLLRTLTAQLQQGDSITIGLEFGISGSITGLLVPVQGADVDGTFLPSAPPPPPSSASATPVSSAPASSPASGPPVASTAPGGSAPASATASASAATSS